MARIVNIGGRVFEETGARLVNVGGRVFEETVSGAATEEAALTFAATASTTHSTIATAETSITQAINAAASYLRIATAEASYTDGVQASIAYVGEQEAVSLNNNRISAMHFLKIYQPIAIGS